jgi:hypothetical protein
MHLETILGRFKQFSGEITEQFGETRIAAEHSETMDENHPNYTALMTKQDEAVDKVNDFISDLTGIVADMNTLAQ